MTAGGGTCVIGLGDLLFGDLVWVGQLEVRCELFASGTVLYLM